MKKNLLILLFVLLPFLNGCTPHKVGSTEVGIRVAKLGLFGKRGVIETPHGPGTYFFFPILNDWYIFDTRINNLEMTYDPRVGDLKSRDDLLFKSVDGNDISLDVIISWRIDPLKASHILQNVAIDNNTLKNTIVRTIARSKPRDIFGELKTEEFYISHKRAEKSMRAKEILNEILNPYGVIIENVLTKDYRFNKTYQKAIEAKKVADQMVEKNKSATRAKQEEYLKKMQDAIGDIREMRAKVNGEFQQAKISADAYYKKQEFLAQAIEIEGINEAQSIKKMNEALDSSGGITMVKLKIAESLMGKKILVLPFTDGGIDLKSTNLNQLISAYGVKSLSDTE